MAAPEARSQAANKMATSERFPGSKTHARVRNLEATTNSPRIIRRAEESPEEAKHLNKRTVMTPDTSSNAKPQIKLSPFRLFGNVVSNLFMSKIAEEEKEEDLKKGDENETFEDAQEVNMSENQLDAATDDEVMLTKLLSRMSPERIAKTIRQVQEVRGLQFLELKAEKIDATTQVDCSESICSATCSRKNQSVPVKTNIAPEVKSNAAESAQTEKWICMCGFDNFMVRKVCFQCSANKGSMLTKANGVVSRVVTRESYFYAFIESEEGVFCFFPKKNVVTQKLKEGDRVVFKKVEGMKGGKRSRAYEVEVISAAKSLSGTVTKFKQAQTHAWGIIKSERNFYFFTMHRDQELNVGGTVKFCVLSTADNRKNSKGPRYPKVIIKEVEAL